MIPFKKSLVFILAFFIILSCVYTVISDLSMSDLQEDNFCGSFFPRTNEGSNDWVGRPYIEEIDDTGVWVMTYTSGSAHAATDD